MNIKNEIWLALLTWITFTGIVFVAQRLITNVNSSEHLLNILKPLIMIGYLLRNLFAFYAQSLRSIYQAIHKEEIYDYTDNRINEKLQVMTIDTIMTHTLPFSYFKEYIKKTKEYENDDVYLNLYCLIKIFKNKVEGLEVMTKNHSKKGKRLLNASDINPEI